MSNKLKPTDVPLFMQSLDFGKFAEKLSLVLSEVAAHTGEYGMGKKVGKVNLSITMARMGSEGNQLLLSHKIEKQVPTARGKATEEDTTETAMFIHAGGELSDSPPLEDLNGQANIDYGDIRPIK